VVVADPQEQIAATMATVPVARRQPNDDRARSSLG
jgi:hypothetical protein